MADLFDEILKQASDNTRNASKELRKIDKTVEHQRRLKAEREAEERRLTKEAIKKNAPLPSKSKVRTEATNFLGLIFTDCVFFFFFYCFLGLFLFILTFSYTNVSLAMYY